MHNYIKVPKRILITALLFLIIFCCAIQAALVFTYAMEPGREKEVKQRTEEILNRSEFAEKEEDSTFKAIAQNIKQAIDDIKDRIMRLLEKIKLPNVKLPENDAQYRGAGTVVKIIVIVAIAFLAALIAYMVSKSFHTARRIRCIEEDNEILLSLKDSDVILNKAIEYANKGDYRQGIRYMYIAMLIKFNERNIIKIDKSKTNKQYVTEIRNSGFKMVDMVQEFTYDFNWFWYGNRKPDRSKFDYWSRSFDLLFKEVNA